MLSDRYLSVLSDVCPVCNVGVLRPYGSMDQNETWYAGRPWSWPHCVRRGPSSPSPKGAQPLQFSAKACCETARWIKMPLRREVGLDPRGIVLDGDPAPSQKGDRAPSAIFGSLLLWRNGWMHQDATWYGCRPQPSGLCVRWRPSRPSSTRGWSPSPQIVGACLLWLNCWMDQDATWQNGRPQPRRLF